MAYFERNMLIITGSRDLHGLATWTAIAEVKGCWFGGFQESP